jgi:GT2 family glycosyltransferase/glycosyltransferase involved in cell wall biosynthesis
VALHSADAEGDQPGPQAQAVTEVTLPRVEDPLVSVVMVLYGGAKLAKRAISALAENTDPSYELILVDNASPDDSLARVEEHVSGARIIRNDSNRGFGAASNQGAHRARGRYACFLNSDALVQADWLPPLLETVAERDVGAVVPMYLNENGTLQEAGSVVDSVGHAHMVGRDADPNDFRYRFRREVDFGSAACMLLSTGLFLELGGFDELFSPGYFEDTDLCFRLHERGLRTLYEPRSRVVHLMHGSGTSESARETMERNRGAFVDRWGERLARRPRVVQAASEPSQMLAARDSEALERILVIDDRVPFADRGSGDPRMARMLGELAALWPSARITLLAATGLEAERYAEPLLQQGIEIVCPPVDFNQWFRERRFHYGLAIVSRHTNMLRFGGFLNQTQPQALTVFDSEALTFHRLERQAEVLPPGERRNDVRIQAAKARNSEIHAVQHADVVFVVTNEEAEFVAEVAPGKPTFVLPSFVETLADPPGFDERSDVIFFGGFLGGAASPNEDALAFLVHEVMPLFWERHPSVGLTVIGADMSDSVRALESPRVRIVGYVEDPSGWLSRARLHVNPMRFGSGLKLKFLDSLAAGLPFVTTPIGSEGLALGELRESLVAGGPIALAERMSALYTDREEWERAQAYLLDLGETRFDRASFQRTLIEGLSHVGIAPPPRMVAR